MGRNIKPDSPAFKPWPMVNTMGYCETLETESINGVFTYCFKVEVDAAVDELEFGVSETT